MATSNQKTKTRRRKKGEETVLNRTTILALAAVAAIGAASLASSSTFAMGNQGTSLSGKSNGVASKPKKNPDIGMIGKPKKNPDIGNINKPGKVTWPNWHWRHRHHRHWWHYPVIVRNGGSSVAYAASPTTVTPSTCNCLTKEYLADGSVLFKDLCTKEAAVMPASSNQAQQ
jgi:hypothetical protein